MAGRGDCRGRGQAVLPICNVPGQDVLTPTSLIWVFLFNDRAGDCRCPCKNIPCRAGSDCIIGTISGFLTGGMPSPLWLGIFYRIWLSLACRSDMKRIILQSVLFLALSGLPFKGLGFLSGSSPYLIDSLIFEGLTFPNTFDTITEVQVPFGDILMRISGSVWLGALSL